MRVALFALICAALRAQSHWPAQLAIDVKSQSWESAVRVGAAIVEEIDAGRMFVTFADIAKEIDVRTMYAEALDRTGKREEARRERSIAHSLAESPERAPGYMRRLSNLKAEVLATEVDQVSKLPHAEAHATIVAFWAEWCALCKPELETLARYSNPRVQVVRIDVDHMNSVLREYAPGELPQLYVVDARGNIRFHVEGFRDEAFFGRKLDFMIEAATR